MNDNPCAECCCICKDPISTSKSTQIKGKGDKGINAASNKRGESLLVVPGEWVHDKCREKWINPKGK